MLELAVFICLIIIYFTLNRDDFYDPEVIGASVFLLLYLAGNLLLPVYVQSPRIGQLIDMLPMGALCWFYFRSLMSMAMNGQLRRLHSLL